MIRVNVGSAGSAAELNGNPAGSARGRASMLRGFMPAIWLRSMELMVSKTVG